MDIRGLNALGFLPDPESADSGLHFLVRMQRLPEKGKQSKVINDEREHPPAGRCAHSIGMFDLDKALFELRL